MTTDVESFFDPETFTLTHLVTDAATARCAVIDPVLDFEAASGRTSTHSADTVIARIKERGLTCDWVLDTHIHADHLSGAAYVREKLGGRTGVGAKVSLVQETFTDIFHIQDVTPDGSQFDVLFSDGDIIRIGELSGYAMETPGHTPACMTYVFGDAAFIGDTLFAPDFGSARCDFPGGDAATLHASIDRLLALPDETRLFLCHDYLPGGRDLVTHTSVKDQRDGNVHLNAAPSAEDFAAMRAERDAGLSMPALILPSVQVNIRAGQLPPPEDDGFSYLKLPMNKL